MKNVNSDIAYNFIRKRILNGEYAPGAALMTKDLAAEIGVSRTPVRDALRQLEADGLVSIRARLGASVKRMDLKEFREMCGLRLALETYAAGLAAQVRTPGDTQEIGFALENMRVLTERIVESPEEPGILAELMREDVRFHIAIMAAAKSEVLKKEILRLHLINRLVSSPMPVQDAERQAERRRWVFSSHEQIFRAISEGRVRDAKDAMELHIQDIIDHHIRALSRSAHGVVARELTEDELTYTA